MVKVEEKNESRSGLDISVETTDRYCKDHLYLDPTKNTLLFLQSLHIK